MKSTVENLSPTRVRLAVEAAFTDLQPSLEAAYRTIGQQVRVPGFRPGKVPTRIIDQRVGRGTVVAEAVNEVLPRLYGEAAREHSLQVLGQPEITEITDAENITDGADWHFTAEVDIRPEITLPELEGIALQVDDVEVSDDDVEQQLGELRERFGTLTGVERATETGDYVSLDLTTEIDGEEVEDGSMSGLSYVIGSEEFMPELDDAITGVSAGDTAAFTTTLAGGEHAGEEAQVSATVKSVKVKELPEVDDEFASMASEFDTVDELRADVRERLGRVRVLEQGAQARDRLLEHLSANTDFPLPESAVTAEIEYRQHDVLHSLNHDDALLERYLQAQGTTRVEWDAQLRENAEQSVRAQFILDAIAEQTNAQVGDGELTDYLVQQAQRYQMAPQEFANQIMQSGNLPTLVGDIRRNKALAELLESATVTDASGNAVDLSALEADESDDAGVGEVAEDDTDDVDEDVNEDDTDDDGVTP